jgi:fatty-acyl-CoA synthase
MTTTRTSSESPVIRNSSTVSDLIRRSAGRFPTDTAIEFGDRTWTYAELDAAVTAVARELVRHGVTKGDRVAAYGKNSDLFVLLYLGCARAGFIHVPVNYQLKNDELDYILSNSGAEIVFADADLMSAVTSTPTGAEAQVIDFADLVPVATAEEIAPATVRESSPSTTRTWLSCSTPPAPPRRRKGAVMTHRALLHEYLSSLMSLDFAAKDRAVHALPLYHSAQMHVFLLPLLSIGAHNIIVPAPVPEQLLAIFEEREINSFFAAPTVWVALANSPDLETRNLDSLHKAYYGASIMPGPILERLRQRLPQLGFYNCFGQSELGPLCTVLRPEEHDDHPGSAGRPVMFVETRVVDADGDDVGPGEEGEILYRSPQLCEGYWNRPEATAEAFDNGWFHSGDLVKVDEDGFVEVVDRVKDVINTGGVLVASRQVEDADLRTAPGRRGGRGRDCRREVDRGGRRLRRPQGRTAAAVGRRCHRSRQVPLGRVQGAQAGGVRCRTAEELSREDPQAQPAPSLRARGRSGIGDFCGTCAASADDGIGVGGRLGGGLPIGTAARFPTASCNGFLCPGLPALLTEDGESVVADHGEVIGGGLALGGEIVAEEDRVGQLQRHRLEGFEVDLATAGQSDLTVGADEAGRRDDLHALHGREVPLSLERRAVEWNEEVDRDRLGSEGLEREQRLDDLLVAFAEPDDEAAAR